MEDVHGNWPKLWSSNLIFEHFVSDSINSKYMLRAFLRSKSFDNGAV